MLKFQDNNTTVIATFEDFILTAYVIIDELYHQFAPPEVTRRRHILNAKLSDSEIMTISFCVELAGVDYDKGLNDIKCQQKHIKCVQYVVLAWDRQAAVYYVLK